MITVVGNFGDCNLISKLVCKLPCKLFCCSVHILYAQFKFVRCIEDCVADPINCCRFTVLLDLCDTRSKYVQCCVLSFRMVRVLCCRHQCSYRLRNMALVLAYYYWWWCCCDDNTNFQDVLFGITISTSYRHRWATLWINFMLVISNVKEDDYMIVKYNK